VNVDAVVVGAGHNGLVAAAYLAKSGLDVVVCERNDAVGGAAFSESPWPGWTVSAASYVCSLLHPQIIAELDLAGHGYDAYRKDPHSFNVSEDGRSMLLGADHDANAREIASFSKKDVAGYFAYEAVAERLGSRVFEAMTDDEPSLSKFDAPTRRAFESSAAELAETFVETPLLQAALATDGIIGTYAGPRDPGTGYVLAHHLAGRAFGAQGAWGYVRGGMGAISKAIAAAAQAAGARILTQAPVASVMVRGERACGVVLRDGREITARAVLSNADPKTTFLDLVSDGVFDGAFTSRVRDWACTGVSFKLNLALGELPNFTSRPSSAPAAHHRASIHTAPDIDHIQRAHDEARAGGVSSAPFLECFLQSPTDPSVAPPGKHLLSIFAQYFPYDRADGPWTDSMRADAADSIVATIARFAPNVPNAVEHRQILAPPDLERRFGMHRGHIFHGELLPGQIFERRFATKTPLQGLYLCGSGAHPGGCVSGVPGLRAARSVARDLIPT
jgi:phytoene dehydrogenase-like protein